MQPSSRSLFVLTLGAILGLGMIEGCTEVAPENVDGGSVVDDDDAGTECETADCPGLVAEDDTANCERLSANVCGLGGGGPDCSTSTACFAAGLLAEYEPASCFSALTDESRFPECGESPCDALVLRVCGSLDDDGAPCADEVGCPPAQTLRQRSLQSDDIDDAIAATRSCRASLEDNVVFEACTQG